MKFDSHFNLGNNLAISLKAEELQNYSSSDFKKKINL